MSNAYVEVAHTKVSSNVAAVDLANCMSDTYMNYYIVCANVTLDADGGYAITGKVSNTTKTSTDCNHAGRVSDMGGAMGRAVTSTFGGQTTYIMAQRSYNFQTALTGNNSLLEGYLFNTRSSSHNKYSIYNTINGTSNTNDRFWRYRMQGEDDSTDVYDGLYITPLTASNFTGGTFTLYGMRES
tara:strand:- start:425 stop:976 length:552 start_codon:yes stop_codon:yes gene_type:complete